MISLKLEFFFPHSKVISHVNLVKIIIIKKNLRILWVFSQTNKMQWRISSKLKYFLKVTEENADLKGSKNKSRPKFQF